jgi:hypothetical protein
MATMDEQLAALSAAISKVQVASGNTISQTYAYGSVPPETIVSGSSVDDILSAAQNLNRNLYKAEEEAVLSQIPAVNAWVTPLRQMEQRDGEGNQGTGEKGVNPIHLGHMTVFQDQESKSGMYMSSAKDETFIALEHGPSASYLEIQNDGSMVQGIYGNNYTIIAKDNKVLVQGVCHISVVGDCLLEIQGNKIEHVKGDYKLRVDGNLDVLAKANISMITGGDVRLATGGTTNSIILEAPSELGVITLNGHTNVRGRLTADTIGSEGALSTGFNGGLFVGLGGIVDLGGILCGIPGATGGAPGVITSSVSVISPLGLFGGVRDYSGFLHTLRGIFNVHLHGGVETGRGVTSDPEPKDGAATTGLPASLGTVDAGSAAVFT